MAIYINGDKYDMLGLTVGIEGGEPDLIDLTITPSTSQQSFNHVGHDGYDNVTVNAIQTETKSATPSETAQTIGPTTGKYLTSVSVGAISNTYVGSAVTRKAAATITPGTTTQTIAANQYLTGVQTISGDTDLVAGNIKKGVNIFGVTGTFEGGGGGSVSIEPTSETWQHNTWVTLTVDIDEEGNLSIRQSAGSGTTTGLKICYPQGSSTAITKIPNIPTTPGTYELPITASWSGDSNDHTLTYTVISGGGGTITTEPLTVTQNGTYTAPSGKAYTPVTVNVSGSTPSTQEKTVTPTASTQTVTPDSGKYLSKVTVNGDADLIAGNIKQGVNIFGVTGTYTGSGGGGGNIGQAAVTPSSNATTVTISRLLGQPKWFMFFPTADVPAASGSRRVTAHTYAGDDQHDYGWALISSGSSWSATYSVAVDSTNFSHTYSNGTLTLRSGSATTGGVYHNVQYALVYGY